MVRCKVSATSVSLGNGRGFTLPTLLMRGWDIPRLQRWHTTGRRQTPLPSIAGQGFEPRLNGSEPFVLPLHHPAMKHRNSREKIIACQVPFISKQNCMTWSGMQLPDSTNRISVLIHAISGQKYNALLWTEYSTLFTASRKTHFDIFTPKTYNQ